MSKFSSLLRLKPTAAVPVGGVQRFAETMTANQIQDGDITYLRSGVVVPYDSSKHDPNAPRVARWAFANPITGQVDTQNYGRQAMFARGQAGTLAALQSQYGADGAIYSFMAPDGTGVNEPELIVYPPQTITALSDSGFKRSTPAYLPAHDCWVFVEINSPAGMSGLVMNIYSSKDGSSWVKASITAYQVSSNYLVNTSVAPIIACCGQSIFVAFNDMGSPSYANLLRLRLTEDRTAVAGSVMTAVGPSSSNNHTLTAVNANEVMCAFSISPSTGGAFGVNESGEKVFSPNLGTDVNMGDRVRVAFNQGRVVVFHAATNTVWGGSTLSGMAPQVSFITNMASAGSAHLVWTGEYFLGWTANSSDASYQGFFWSATGAPGTWYTLLGGTQTLPGCGLGLFSGHFIEGSSNSLYSMATRTTTVASVSSPANTSPVCLVEFNGRLFGLVRINNTGAFIVEVLNNGTRLVYKTYCGSSAQGSYLKVVNGMLLFLGTSIPRRSADGDTWADITGHNLSMVYDAEYFNGRYYFGGTGAAYNYAHSADFSTWGNVTVVSYAAPIRCLLNMGTAMLVCVQGYPARRTTDGVTMASVATLAGGLSSRVFGKQLGGTTYLWFLVNGSTPNQTQLATSTDAGATWTQAVATGLSNGVPCSIHAVTMPGDSVPTYFTTVGSPNSEGVSASPTLGVYSGKSLSTLTPVPVAVKGDDGDYGAHLFSWAGKLCYGSSIQVQNSTSTSDSYGDGQLFNVVYAPNGGLVGCDRIIESPGEIGFIRIK